MSASVQGHTGQLFEPIYPPQHLDLQWCYFLHSEVFFKYHECLLCCREIDRGPWEQWPEKQEQFAYQSKVTESQSREERMEICQAHTREREMRQRTDRKVGNAPVHGWDLEGTRELH